MSETGHFETKSSFHLADLKIEKAAEEGERCTIEADLGPVVALLLDPAAVLLLLAAASVRPR